MNSYKILSLIGTIALLSACGSQTARTTTSANGSTTGTTISGTSIATTGGNIYNLPQAPEQTVQLSGINGPAPIQTLNAGTSRTLKIKITALNAPNLTIPGYTGWVFPYGCLQVSVSVNGVTQTTQVLKVANIAQGSTSACANASDHQVLDFTNAMTGSGNVTISFNNASSDNCRYYWPLNYGCQMAATWQNHMVQFNAGVQTDGLWMDP